MELLILFWVGCGVVAGLIAGGRGRSFLAFFALGMVIGPFGVIIASLFSPTDERREHDGLESGELSACPRCRETIKTYATICPHCRSTIDWQ